MVAPDGWHICGDANSRLLAESIELPRVLGVESPRQPPSDIVLRALAAQSPPYDRQGLRWLLDNKTQNKPYHSLVLAIAMLIEHRLPHAALMGGDFEPEQAQQAPQPAPQAEVIAHACQLLGRPAPPLIPLEEANLSPQARAFYAENRRVSNLKAKRVLNWRPLYPNYRLGLRALSATTRPASASAEPAAAIHDQR